MVHRIERWPESFLRAVDLRADTHFAYGFHDCCKAGAYLLYAITDYDFSSQFPNYNQRKKARRIVARAGGFEQLVVRIANDHGIPSCLPLEARRCDPVVAHTNGFGPAVGLVDLTGQRVILPAGRGWAYVGMERIIRAWRID